MTDMGWFLTADTAEFLAEAGEFLHAEQVRNTVVLTMTENLRVKAAAADPAPDARLYAGGAARSRLRGPRGLLLRVGALRVTLHL